MHTRIFHTADLTLAAALSTLKGASLGYVTVNPKEDGCGYMVAFEINYEDELQPAIDKMVKQYEANTLMLNVRSLGSQLSYCRYLFNLKVKQYQEQL